MAAVKDLIAAGEGVNEKDRVSDSYNHSLLPTNVNIFLSIPPPSAPPPTYARRSVC